MAALDEWRRTVVDDDRVEDAQKEIIFAPLSWLRTNSEKVMIALVIAYLLARFGL